MSTCAALWPTSIDTCVCVCACDQEYLRFFSLPAPLPHLVTPHSRYFRALWAISVCTWPGSSPERTHLSRRRKDFCLELENKSGREERCAGRRWKSGTRLAKREERCEEEEEGEEGTDLPVFPLGFLLFFWSLLTWLYVATAAFPAHRFLSKGLCVDWACRGPFWLKRRTFRRESGTGVNSPIMNEGTSTSQVSPLPWWAIFVVV